MEKPGQQFTGPQKPWLRRTALIVLGTIVVIAGRPQHANADAAPGQAPRALPSPNAYDFYVKAGRAMVPGTPAVDPIFSRLPTGAMAQDEHAYPLGVKQAWLQQNAAALALLRQGLAYRYLEPPQQSRNGTFAPYASFRALARMLMVESHARSQQGDWLGAADSALDAMRLGHDVARGGALISALVSYAIQAIGHRELWRTLPQLDAAAARTAGERLQDLREHKVAFGDTMPQEKQWGLAQLQEQMRDTNWRRDNGLGLTAHQRKMLGPITTTDIIGHYTRLMDAIIANCQRSYRKQQRLPPPGDPVTAIVAPVFINARCAAARTDARNDMLLVALALRAYLLEHRVLPNQLPDLVPAYLKQVPPDPFGSGEPLRYRVEGDTYRLWSIGPDGVDNRGKPIHDAKATTPHANPDAPILVRPDSKGDIVAGVNR